MKNILITGANKGIGLETARQLLEKGYYVFLGCRDASKGLEALQQLQASGFNQVELLEMDVTDEKSVVQAKKSVESKISCLDGLINNAGILGEVPQDASSMPVTTIRKVFDTNFFGMVQVTQAMLPLLKNAEIPCIVNVTSDLASLTRHQNPEWEFYHFHPAAYGPSKTALNAYTVMLAKELKDSHFKINAVNPGHTATDFNNYRGKKSSQQAAKVIVQYAILDKDGPSGKFFSEDGETPW